MDMKREFQDLLANISLMMIVGKRYFGQVQTVKREKRGDAGS